MTKFTSFLSKPFQTETFQKCLISCRTILLDVRHNMSLSAFSPWHHSGFQISLILRALVATIGVLFFYVPLLALKQMKLIQNDLTWMIVNQHLKQWKQYFDVFVFFLGTICHLTKNRNNINRTFKSNSNCILKEAHKSMRKRLCGLCQNVYKNVI